MNIDKALEILEKDSLLNHNSKCPLLEGMQIIAKNSYSTILRSADHDEMYYGDFKDTVENMTREEVIRLHQLGWMQKDDTWLIFV